MEDSKLNPAQKLQEVLKDFNTAMLVTSSTTGSIHSRPMAIADRDERGTLWFVTSLTNDSVKEIERSSMINVAMQGKVKFVSMTCNAQVVRDRARLDKVWNDSMKLWFPKGKEDPDIIFIQATPQIGEYWDNSGLNAFKFAIEAVKALASGTEMKTEKTQHAVVARPS